jgi:hypothetical protein
MNKNEMVIYFIERLGDRIVLKYFAENVKRNNPDAILYSYEEFGYESVKEFTVKEWMPGIFDGHFERGQKVNGIHICAENFIQTTGIRRKFPKPGNLFVYAPIKIAKTGLYPTLKIPPKMRQWKQDELSALIRPNKFGDRPVVCFHILLDAPYSRSRNHYFPEWEKCIKMLSKKDVLIIRIGYGGSARKDLSNIGKNVVDLAVKNLKTPQSIAAISACDIYVGGDTGMTHAASALGKKVVGIWGDITHMLRNQKRPNDIKPGDWDSGPYVPEENRYMLRRSCGEHNMQPIFNAGQIMEGIDHFLRRL